MRLPAEVSEGAVSLRHLVSFIPLTDHLPLIGAGVLDLVRESNVHRRATFGASGIHDPTHSEHRIDVS